MKFKLYSLLAAVAVATTVFFASCSEDKCKNVTCQNLGTCIDGACECASGYEGTNCETLSRAKFLGNYTFDETPSSEPAGTNYPNTFSSGTANNEMIISNFGGYSTAIVTVKVAGSTFSKTDTLSTGAIQIFDISGNKNATSGKITYTYKSKLIGASVSSAVTFTAVQR